MKTVQVFSYGGPEVLEIKEIPDPVPQKNQVLVETYAAGLNPFDAKLFSGAFQKMIPLQFPATMGGDFAGTVKQVGEGVTTFRTGDQVYGTVTILGGGSGAYAEMATAAVGKIALKPKAASFEESAALPVAGLSVVQAIEEHFKLRQGQKILIHGGAGGIGHMAIQLAKSIGAYVATTASSNDKEFVRSLGADEVIDYKTQRFETVLKDYDAVFDTVGGEATKMSFLVLKKGGILVSMLGKPSEELAKQYGVTVIGQNTLTDSVHLAYLAKLIDYGKIKVHIDRIFSLSQVTEAFVHLKSAHPRGKVVLKIRDK